MRIALIAATAATAAAGLAGPARRAAADVTAPRPPALVGVTQEARFAPTKGFVDDAVTAAGGRVAYIATDGATFADLIVYDLASKAEALHAPLPADLGTATELHLLGDGDKLRVFVAARAEDGSARGAVIDKDGKAVRRFGPAADVTLVVRAGTPRVALHRVTVGARGNSTTHELELDDVDTGKKVGKVKTLDVDGGGTCARLDFHVNHWARGFTVAVGTKGGHWDRKENQRTPDEAAEYDVVDGKFTTHPVTDVLAAAHAQQVMAGRPAGADDTFARMSDDLTTVELWRAGAPTALALDQPVAQYDPQSLTSGVDDQGAAWLGLEVDPTNAEAVRRKKADPQYLDLFVVDGAAAARKGRVLATPKKLYRWGVAGGRWWLLERSVGYDRGGSSLTIYKLGG